MIKALTSAVYIDFSSINVQCELQGRYGRWYTTAALQIA